MINRAIRRLLPLVYSVLAIISVLLVFKPGSSIFFYKSTMKGEQISHDSGYSYRYLVNASPLIFSFDGILVYEDDRPLERSSSTMVVDKGGGNFSLSDPSSKKFFVYFSTSDNSDPRTGNRNYKIYYPVVFLSHEIGIISLEILSFGIAWFLFFILKSAKHRQASNVSPDNLVLLYYHFLDQEVARVFSPIFSRQPLVVSKRTIWSNLFLFSIGAAYFYVFMEWLFFVTKPSFMDLMSWMEKIGILQISGFIIALACGILLLICLGLDIFFARIRMMVISLYIGALIPTLIFSITCLLLADNFTYTIFKFGIVSTDSILRGAYGLTFVILFYYIYTRVLSLSGINGRLEPHKQPSRVSYAFFGGLIAVSIILVFVQIGVGLFSHLEGVGLQGTSGGIASRPNILLIAGDGLNAENLSAYGYTHDTTPTLRKLAQDSLLAENAFPNAAHSAGSDISILTGKLPTQTRVLYPPDILKGVDAYQHLPGLLRKIGYSTAEIGVPHYVDAYQMNLLDGFDRVNHKTLNENEVVRFARERGVGYSLYFTSSLIQRVSSRLSHIFFIQKMENPYTLVTQPIGKLSDRGRLEQLKTLIQESNRPLFVHVHMMGTHGPKFSSEQQIFSKGEVQDEDWMLDFYNDGILNFDRYIGELLDTLKTTSKLDNTIIIIYSDHAMKYDVRVRTPLLIHFPRNDYAGRIQNNVQNLDIAPTILEYMGIPQPDWMGGLSLLKGNPPEHRLVFSSGVFHDIQMSGGIWETDTTRGKPLYYHLDFLNVIDCNHWYQFDLIHFELTSGEISGHTAPCVEESMLTLEQAKAELTGHLSENGFDVSALP
jgi:Sulfatase